MLKILIVEIVDFLSLLTVLFIFAVGLISVIDAALDRHFWPALRRVCKVPAAIFRRWRAREEAAD